jgi:hypothetical protein
VAEGARAGGRAQTGGIGSVSDRGGERADRAGPASEGKRTAAGVRGGPTGGGGGLRAVRSRPDRGNQTGKDERLRAVLTGWTRRQARMREAVPAVRAVRSESDGGDQTRETDDYGWRRSSPRR